MLVAVGVAVTVTVLVGAGLVATARIAREETTAALKNIVSLLV